MTVETRCKSHILYYSGCAHIYQARGSHSPAEDFPCNEEIHLTIDYEPAKCDLCGERGSEDERKLPDYFKRQPGTGTDTIDRKYVESEMADLSSYWERATTANRKREQDLVEIKRKMTDG